MLKFLGQFFFRFLTVWLSGHQTLRTLEVGHPAIFACERETWLKGEER